MFRKDQGILWVVICSVILIFMQDLLSGSRRAIASPYQSARSRLFGSQAKPTGPELFATNTSVPFCYKEDGTREWAVFSGRAESPVAIRLVAKRNGNMVAQSKTGALNFDGIRVVLNEAGELKVTSLGKTSKGAFDLEISLDRGNDVTQTQILSLRPAPPPRPISYISDFIDDLIDTFDSKGKWKKGKIQFNKPLFDQYFRRMQCQGITQIVVGLAPCPLITDSSAYAPADWDRFEKQARAVLTSHKLSKALIQQKSGLSSWEWLRAQFAFILNEKAQTNFVESARDHGIALSIGIRPFEAAVSKFYEIPVFGANGRFLWDFLPLTSPAVNYHASEVGFAQYREILKRMGLGGFGEIGAIEIRRPHNVAAFMRRWRSKRDNLRILLSEYPPLQGDSFVLQRQKDNTFEVRRFAEIETLANAQRRVLTDAQIQYDREKGIVIRGLQIPIRYRYILLENPSGNDGLGFRASAVKLWSKGGTPLGRTDVYWAFDESTPERKATLVAGIPNDLGYHTVFFASESSAKYVQKLKEPPRLNGGNTLVVNRGNAYSSEMIDWNRPAARASIVRQVRSILRYSAFSGGIFINTRSHTQLAGNMADGSHGIRPEVWYETRNADYHHLGIDLGYAPRRVALHTKLRSLASNPLTLPRITTWQAGEWTGSTEGLLGSSSNALTSDRQPGRGLHLCESSNCRFPWRYARNVEVAGGVRLLLQDLVSAFPSVRIRVVLPEREPVMEAVSNAMSKMEPGTVSYTNGRNDWIRDLGEGMAMLNLSGMSVEPVLLGTGPNVDMKVLNVYLNSAIKDMRDNHGSSFHGPKQIIYEGQFTLNQKGGQKVYEQRICSMLTHPKAIGQVDLYESAAWLYDLPMENQDIYDFSFLDRCPQVLNKYNAARQANNR